MNLENYMLPCLNKKFLGLPCMGCGFQRAVLLLLQGDFVGAFKMYPAIYSLLFFVGYVCLNFKFNFNNSHRVIQALFALNILLIVGNYIKVLYL